MSDIDPNIDKTELVADVAALDNFNRNVVEEFRANGGKVGGPSRGARYCCCTPREPNRVSPGCHRWPIWTSTARC